MTARKTNNPRVSMAHRKAPLTERFHSRYIKEVSGCWVWLGTRAVWGYGVLHNNRKPIMAHRLSYQLHKGDIPQGMHVCHKCDNPPCVNPEHLFLGTPADNMKDRDSKNRGPIGERNWCTKLTKDDIPVIRQLAENGMKQNEIAQQFGVHQGTISHVVNRTTWKHVN